MPFVGRCALLSVRSSCFVKPFYLRPLRPGIWTPRSYPCHGEGTLFSQRGVNCDLAFLDLATGQSLAIRR
ncbi:hypothetical protein EMPG_12135 [Blastomyces silverae]|uniref:Uncharacterized protein n=1 Tax=Blastomyces silverae TaxID=2060906 RepID=A0A0H1BP63_9EURO|nr:hypothetical protein EMPG_12135 [Blastomyces silverae]